jgi:hypothetical protein
VRFPALATASALTGDEVRTSIRALPFVLIVTTAAPSASAQTLACYPIRPGDTAARLARQLTGYADNRHQPWFQIVEPLSETVISKRNYSRIQTGWHVCVAAERIRGFSGPSGHRATATSGVPTSRGLAPPPSIEWRILGWAALLVMMFTGAFTWVSTRRYLDRRRLLVAYMTAFGQRFVNEFERPLFRNRLADAVSRSRLRLVPRRRRLEILLAPAAGRTYPNLVDHRMNVEYDVDRIVTILDDGRFANAPLYSEGEWVVIPFHMARNR